jgi:flagellar protein FliL
MADTEEPMENPEAEAITDETEGSPRKGKKKVILAAALFLICAIGAGLYFSGMLGGKEKELPKADAAKAEKAAPAAPVYYDLPEFLVNLSNNNRVSFLKMSVTLELRDQEAVKTMDALKPRVMDTFNTYLRELRPSDLAGSAGIYRLREELMLRMNKTVQDGAVKDVLIVEFLVQ